jgi:uncharacterized membrane protein
MRARLWQFYEDISESFWLFPSFIVSLALALAVLLINAERWDIVPEGFLASWLYSGGETGARTLLGAVAGSTIGVAGTVFSITIATLTLASNQMGPRLLRNFTRDRGNQATLGIYLGTITGTILLALLCVAMLIYFVHHVASRINFDTVIEMVSRDLNRSLKTLTDARNQCPAPPDAFWENGLPIVEARSGYIQQLDEVQIADWAEKHGVAVRLYARAGDFVFPGVPIALVVPGVADAQKVLKASLVLGAYPTLSMDMEFAVDQLVDIAVRALSPGINDPNTAIRILDRLGAALCHIAAKPLFSGVIERNGKTVFQRNITTYDGLIDAMLLTIRQNAKGVPPVLIRMAEILTKVAQCETAPERLKAIHRHAALILEDGTRSIQNVSDRQNLADRITTLFSILSANMTVARVPTDA